LPSSDVKRRSKVLAVIDATAPEARRSLVDNDF
jgi:hypothetical protein